MSHTLLSWWGGASYWLLVCSLSGYLGKHCWWGTIGTRISPSGLLRNTVWHLIDWELWRSENINSNLFTLKIIDQWISSSYHFNCMYKQHIKTLHYHTKGVLRVVLINRRIEKWSARYETNYAYHGSSNSGQKAFLHICWQCFWLIIYELLFSFKLFKNCA